MRAALKLKTAAAAALTVAPSELSETGSVEGRGDIINITASARMADLNLGTAPRSAPAVRRSPRTNRADSGSLAPASPAPSPVQGARRSGSAGQAAIPSLRPTRKEIVEGVLQFARVHTGAVHALLASPLFAYPAKPTKMPCSRALTPPPPPTPRLAEPSHIVSVPAAPQLIRAESGKASSQGRGVQVYIEVQAGVAQPASPPPHAHAARTNSAGLDGVTATPKHSKILSGSTAPPSSTKRVTASNGQPRKVAMAMDFDQGGLRSGWA
jgi:hypothetical protein